MSEFLCVLQFRTIGCFAVVKALRRSCDQPRIIVSLDELKKVFFSAHGRVSTSSTCFLKYFECRQFGFGVGDRKRRYLDETQGAPEGCACALISSEAEISSSARLSSGCVVLSGAVINADVVIGCDVLVEKDVVVEHDCVIGARCSLGRGSILGGGVSLGSDVKLEEGVVVCPNVSICDGATLTPCAVVTKSIRKKGVYSGAPARCG